MPKKKEKPLLEVNLVEARRRLAQEELDSLETVAPKGSTYRVTMQPRIDALKAKLKKLAKDQIELDETKAERARLYPNWPET